MADTHPWRDDPEVIHGNPPETVEHPVGSPRTVEPGTVETTGATETTDVVVIGTGSAGKPLAGELARAGVSVLAVEDALVGGECPHLACIPSKALLLAARRYRERVGPVGGRRPDPAGFAAAVALRDRITQHRDDTRHLTGLEKDGVRVVRGSARVDGRRVLVRTAAGIRAFTWRRALVVATGSEAVLPPIDGLAALPPWTSADALSGDELPERLAILGGGPIGCELAQVYATFGSAVTLIERSGTVLPHESGWVGRALMDALARAGVTFRTGTELRSATPLGPSPGSGLARLHLADGDPLEVDRLLVAVGKRPRTAGLGLETLGITPGEDGALAVDERCRARVEDGVLPDVFAIGDVTAIAPYTHTANLHARTVAAHLLGHGRDVDHTGIPRAVYTDPPVLSAGVTAPDENDGPEASEDGARLLTSRRDVTETSRAALERAVDPIDQRPAGVDLVADAETGVLLGAAAIGPEADSWAAGLAMAVRTRMTVADLADHPHPFPSWSEPIGVAARDLAERVARSDR